MASPTDILITGAGVVSPIGVGVKDFWQGLATGRNGISWREGFENEFLPVSIGGVVRDFDGRLHIKPRKAIKVMCREIQFGHASAIMAHEDSGMLPEQIDLTRMSVIFGSEPFQAEPEEVQSAIAACTREGRFDFSEWGERSMREIQPLWMLKYLPNMVASHISIAIGATGPNNTICQGGASASLAVIEAATLIQRGWSDVAIAGGTGSRVQMNCYVGRGLNRMCQRFDSPETASRPFHPARNGFVCGEGAASLVLESRESQQRRNGKILGRLAGWSRGYCPNWTDQSELARTIATVASCALDRSRVEVSRVNHVNANGVGLVTEDAAEAQAIRQLAPGVSVVAMKSNFGNTGAGTAALEILGSVLSLQHRQVPPTLNISDSGDMEGLNLLTRAEARPGDVALKISLSENGHVVVIVLARE